MPPVLLSPRLRSAVLLSSALLAGLAPLATRATTFDLSTATVADIDAAFAAGALTSEKLTELYLARIAAYDQQGPKLNTIITLNPKALEIARSLDAERKSKGPRSPLHGIPMLVKDVYNTYDLPTTGGFKPMATSQPSRDSFVIDRLRKAGVVILGKTNQADWYGKAPRGASSLKGQVVSPYNAKKFEGGSSSGTGVAMASWFATIGMGSDTSGSVVIPTAHNSLAGFSTTHGLVSRTGMMWSSPSQENGGPMGRCVYDCAAVLDVIAGYDAADLPTQASVGKMPDRPYTSFVNPTGLKGARVGVLREMFRKGPMHTEGVALAEKAIADFKAAGAIVVDPVLTGLKLTEEQSSANAASIENFYAIKQYLSGLPDTAPIRTVDEMIVKGGDLVKPGIVESAKIHRSLDHDPQLAAAYKQQDMLRAALMGVMEKYELDAIILPYETAIIKAVPIIGGADPESVNALASFTGLPTILVPGGFFPSDGMPFAMQLLGRPFSEPTLIRLASGFEAATHHRKAPTVTPPLPGEHFEYNRKSGCLGSVTPPGVSCLPAVWKRNARRRSATEQWAPPERKSGPPLPAW